MSDFVLETEALTRRFGAFTAVDALSLAVNAGEVFGLPGSNGPDSQGCTFIFAGYLQEPTAARTIVKFAPAPL